MQNKTKFWPIQMISYSESRWTNQTIFPWSLAQLTIFSHEVGSFWTFKFANKLFFSVDLAANLKTAIFGDHFIKILAAWTFDFINWFFIFVFLVIWFFFIVFGLIFSINACTEWFVEFPDSLLILFAFCLGITLKGLANDKSESHLK